MSAHYHNKPSLADRYGPAGLEKCIADVELHVLCIADALDTRSPETFHRYVQWARSTMLAHGVDDVDITESLQCLPAASERAVSGAGAMVAELIASATQRGEHDPSAPHCEISDSRPYANLANRFLQMLLQRRRVDAIQLLVDARVGMRELFMHVFTPVQREIGRLWQIGQIDVGLEHYCTTATREFMIMLGHEVLRPAPRDLTIVGAGVSQELHEVGLRMVCDVFDYEGWRSLYIGANTPDAAIVQAVKRESPDILALSATAPFYTYRVQSLIAQVRQADQRVRILVGGHAFNNVPHLWKRIGADGYAPDADAALKKAYELLERQ